MAIAYFIPDQAKLLAGQRSSRGTNSSRSADNNQTSSRTQQSNQANESSPVNATTTNRGYGTTINISVPTFNNTTQEPLGCWDFLTQVFCHALRFYHESSQLQPTVIQISVNFNTQTATTTSAATTTPDTATRHSQPTPPAAATPVPTPATTEDHKQRKLAKRKN